MIKLLFCCSRHTDQLCPSALWGFQTCSLLSGNGLVRGLRETKPTHAHSGRPMSIWMSGMQFFCASVPHAGILYLSLYSSFHCLFGFVFWSFYFLESNFSQLYRDMVYKKSFSFWQLHNDLTLHMSKHPTLRKNTISLRAVLCNWFDLSPKTLLLLKLSGYPQQMGFPNNRNQVIINKPNCKDNVCSFIAFSFVLVPYLFFLTLMENNMVQVFCFMCPRGLREGGKPYMIPHFDFVHILFMESLVF